jgi:hypothetical protein
MTLNFRTHLPRYVIKGRTAKFAGILWIWRAAIEGRKGITGYNWGNIMENAINSRL